MVLVLEGRSLRDFTDVTFTVVATMVRLENITIVCRSLCDFTSSLMSHLLLWLQWSG